MHQPGGVGPKPEVERTTEQRLSEAMKQFELALAILDSKLTIVKEDVHEMKQIVRGEYIRREEFNPVKQVVFGLVAVILLAVAGALVTLMVRH